MCDAKIRPLFYMSPNIFILDRLLKNPRGLFIYQVSRDYKRSRNRAIQWNVHEGSDFGISLTMEEKQYRDIIMVLKLLIVYCMDPDLDTFG